MADDLTPTPAAPASTESGASIFLLIAVTASWTIANMSYYASAQLVGPLMTRFDRGETQIGGILTQEFTVFALTALFVAGPLSRISRVRVAMYGGAAVVVANLVSGYTDNFELLRMVRTIAGFGGGMVAAAGTAAAASSLNPQRVFAIVTVTWGLMSALQQLVTPYVTVPYGAQGGYYAMAAATLLCMLLCGWLLPPREVEKQAQAMGLDPSVHPSNLGFFARMAERLGVRDAPNRAFALTAMIAVFIYEVGQGVVFPFVEQIGLRTGLDEIAIGEVLGASNFCGLLGGALAVGIGNRFGTLWPLVIGISINALAAFGLTLGENSTAYVLLNFLWNAAFYFVTPYLLGALAEMDDRGRWVVAMDAFWWLGDAPGPLLGGWLIESGGYGSLAAVPLLTGGVCVVSFVWVLRSYNARHKPPSQP